MKKTFRFLVLIFCLFAKTNPLLAQLVQATIPDPGQTFIFHGHRFQIIRRQRNQITTIKVSPPEDEADETEN